MLVVDICSYSMPPISPSRRTKSLPRAQRLLLEGPSAHLLDVMPPANPSPFSTRNSLWNDLDFILGRVKLRSTCVSYPNMSPPSLNFTIGLPEGFPIYTNKTYQPGAFSYPRNYSTQLQTFHLTLLMLIFDIRETFTFRQCCDRRSTTRTITLRVAQPTSTLTTQPSLHYVKGSR